MPNFVKHFITTNGTVCDIQEAQERITVGTKATGLWTCVKYPDGYTVIDYTREFTEQNLTFNQWGGIYSHDWRWNIPFPNDIPALTEVYNMNGNIHVSGLTVIASLFQDPTTPLNIINGFTAIRGADAPVIDHVLDVFVHFEGMRQV